MKSDLLLLKKYAKGKQIIHIKDILSVEHLRKLGLLKIDKLYSNTIDSVEYKYAEITEKGLDILSHSKKKNRHPLFKIFFK